MARCLSLIAPAKIRYCYCAEGACPLFAGGEIGKPVKSGAAPATVVEC